MKGYFSSSLDFYDSLNSPSSLTMHNVQIKTSLNFDIACNGCVLIYIPKNHYAG